MAKNDYLYTGNGGPTFRDALGRDHQLVYKKVEFTESKDNAIHKPTGMGWPEVVVWANNKVMEEESPVTVKETLNAFPFEAAYAIDVVMKDRFGMTKAEGRARVAKFPVDADGTSIEVNMGSFSVPTIQGTWNIEPDFINNVTNLTCNTLFKFKPNVNAAIAQVKEYLKEHSLYKGRALRIEVSHHPIFGDIIQPPEFMDVSRQRMPLILNAGTERLVNAKVFKPLEHYQRLREIGTPFRRGILVYGPWGTGKTLMAHEAARLAERNGITYFYVKSIRDLARIYQFAARYAPAVVFAEDIDQLVNEAVSLSSVFDGVDTKANEIMLIVSTNKPEEVASQAAILLRPGRIDAAIHFPAPDADSAGRLLAMYGQEYMAADFDYERAGRALAGQVPAVIREVIERSKEFVVLDDESAKLTTNDVLLMFEGMRPHLDLLATPQRQNPSPLRELGEGIATFMKNYVEAEQHRPSGSTFPGMAESELYESGSVLVDD